MQKPKRSDFIERILKIRPDLIQIMYRPRVRSRLSRVWRLVFQRFAIQFHKNKLRFLRKEKRVELLILPINYCAGFISQECKCLEEKPDILKRAGTIWFLRREMRGAKLWGWDWGAGVTMDALKKRRRFLN